MTPDSITNAVDWRAITEGLIPDDPYDGEYGTCQWCTVSKWGSPHDDTCGWYVAALALGYKIERGQLVLERQPDGRWCPVEDGTK